MANNRATHIFLKTTGQAGVRTRLYRASDGMLCATCENQTVMFGEDPRPELQKLRAFLRPEDAVSFLRTLADRDWATSNGLDPRADDFETRAKSEFAAVIDIQDTDKRVVLAEDAVRHPLLSKPS